MKNFSIVILSVLAIFFMANTLQVQAQNLDDEFAYEYRFDADTIADSDTLVFVFPGKLVSAYDYAWVICSDTISGTNSYTAALYEGDVVNFGLKHSFSVADVPKDTLLVGQTYATRQKLIVISSGTMSTSVNVSVIYKKRQQ
jgi:hypothetical protein